MREKSPAPDLEGMDLRCEIRAVGGFNTSIVRYPTCGAIWYCTSLSEWMEV